MGKRLTAEIIRKRIAAGTLVLCSGKGDTETGAACIMQAEAILQGRDGSEDDDPKRRVIAAFARRLNDRLRDDERVRLAPYALRIAESPVETVPMKRRRAFMMVDDAVRRSAPSAFESRANIAERSGKASLAVTLRDHAAKMRACAEVVDGASALSARATCNSAAAYAYAAYAYAYAAAAYAEAAAYAAAAYAAAAYAEAAAYADAAYAAADAAAYAAAAAAYADAAAYGAVAAAADAAADRNPHVDAMFDLLDRLLTVTE